MGDPMWTEDGQAYYNETDPPRPKRGYLIGLVGYAQSGKDSVGGILVEEYGYKRVAFADKIREMALLIDPPAPEGLLSLKTAVLMHGWEYTKTHPEHRQFLQNLGIAAREVFGPEIWLDVVLPVISSKEKIVITDVRLRNEIDFITGNGGKIVRVDRPGVGPVNDHITEVNWTGFHPNYTIDNSGTIDDLSLKVFWMMNRLNYP